MQTESVSVHRSEGSLLNSVASLLVGALLGVAVSKMFEDNASFLLTSISAAAILVAGVLCFLTIDHGRRQGRRLEALCAEVARVREQIGEPADLSFEQFENSTGEYYRRLERIIDRLKGGDEVFVMTHHTRRIDEDAASNAAYAASRGSYLDALLRKAAEGVVYRRIVCFEPNDDDDVPVRLELLRAHTREHCMLMLEMATTRPTKVAVKKAPALLMADILIVNHEIGAISMLTYVDASRVYTAGALIVHDPPNGRILNQLRDWWNEADSKSTALRKRDLTEPLGTEPLGPEEAAD